ncbi:hypothetical protein C0J52_17814 [Blattella germanica]|nr:hypothetical protein C0J52_17814 [Blattella germanica]
MICGGDIAFGEVILFNMTKRKAYFKNRKNIGGRHKKGEKKESKSCDVSIPSTPQSSSKKN